jgi:hypothetical protein
MVLFYRGKGSGNRFPENGGKHNIFSVTGSNGREFSVFGLTLTVLDGFISIVL